MPIFHPHLPRVAEVSSVPSKLGSGVTGPRDLKSKSLPTSSVNRRPTKCAKLRRKEELALHRPPGRRLAERADLQPADHCAPVSVGSGGLAVRCAASDPDLHPGQPARVATLELEAAGCLTVEVARWTVLGGRPRQTRNHHTLTTEWEPWGSAYAYC
jgi:hypothetical protein